MQSKLAQMYPLRRWPVQYPATKLVFFFSSRRRHTRLQGDWSSDVCSSDLVVTLGQFTPAEHRNAHCVKVAGADDVKTHRNRFAGPRRRPPLGNRKVPRIRAANWHVVRDGYALNSGQSIKPSRKLFDEAAALGVA